MLRKDIFIQAYIACYANSPSSPLLLASSPSCQSLLFFETVSFLLSVQIHVQALMYLCYNLQATSERKHGICLSGTVLICLLLLSLVANEITPFFFFYGWKKNPCVCGPHFLSHSFAAGPHGWFCDCPSSPSASASMAGLSISVMIDVETLGKHSEVVWLSHVLDLALVF